MNNYPIATILGGGGFIGRYLVRNLTKKNFRCIIPTRNAFTKGYLKTQAAPGAIEFINFNTEEIKNAIENSDIVIKEKKYEAYNNLWTKSQLTGSTNRFSYTPSMTGVGAGPFITTVGLYNDADELLAVAKLSQPILKSKSREALIKVKLDF